MSVSQLECAYQRVLKDLSLLAKYLPVETMQIFMQTGVAKSTNKHFSQLCVRAIKQHIPSDYHTMVDTLLVVSSPGKP